MRNIACEYIDDIITKRVNGEPIPDHIESFGQHLIDAKATIYPNNRDVRDARKAQIKDPTGSNR